MGQAFLCKLKHSVGKLPKGTTIQVLAVNSACNSSDIGKEVERQFGKVPGADFAGHWDIQKL